MTSNEIRQQFLEFFRERGHAIVPSSPVVPLDDPTLMFTNAGMNQFKDVFLGAGSRSYARAADTQKCIRAGGKHNDLDDVGQDTYHHTFFEMLGNWSFGDYFKKEAITWAWELLTKVWGIDKSRLHATYFQGDPGEGLEPDSEAAELWRKVTDINPAHVHPGNKKDNFWEMGDTGPCGPCSEIHIDLTPDKSGRDLVNKSDARVMEIWNLVFIQYNRGPDGKLTPLPAKHVDTGMGFERITAVLQGKTSNYDTDVFAPLFGAIQRRTGAPDYKGTLPGRGTEGPRDPETEGKSNQSPERERRESSVGSPGGAAVGSQGRKPLVGDTHHSKAPEGRQNPTLEKGGAGGDLPSVPQLMIDVSYRVIADHLRCLTFALTDGAIPSNEGRGYVLRRILRRAVRYGRQYLNMHEPFLCDLVQPLVDHMGGAFPELRSAHGGKNVNHVAETLRDEEKAFFKTLDRGLDLFDLAVERSVESFEAEAGNTPFAQTILHFVHSKPHPVWPSQIDWRDFPGERRPIVSGEDAFKLHDTYGFPIDLTELMAGERGLTVNIAEYETLMEEARQRSMSGGQLSYARLFASTRGSMPTQFIGYDNLECETAVDVLVEIPDCDQVRELRAGREGALILRDTSFYAEQGGQVGDSGLIRGIDNAWTFRVRDTKNIHGRYFHFGRCEEGTIYPQNVSSFSFANQEVAKPSSPLTIGRARVLVDVDRRRAIMRNHTVTHVLNWALREALGDHVQQKGSLVDPDKTRFDFSHLKPVEPAEIERIEFLVNQKIEERLPVYTKQVDQKKAREINTLRAVFGEKYPDVVRVVSIGADIHEMLTDPNNPKWMGYSVEFCGGTHVKHTGEIERFMLVAEEGVAKGIRRVVGVSGEAARRAEAEGQRLLAEAGSLSEVEPDALADRLATLQQAVSGATIPVRVRHQLRERIAELQKLAKEHGKRAAAASGDAVKDRVARLFAEAERIGGVTVVVGEVPDAPVDALRSAIDWVRNKTEASAVLLAMAAEGKVTLMAGISKSLVDRGVRAGDLIKEIAPLVGGKGGGRPDMAQGGGTDPAGLPRALEQARAWLQSKLA